MESVDRREGILKLLKEKNGPVKGTDIAKMYDVSRQVIVQDIAILRARGEEIIATPQGYMIMEDYSTNKLVKTIVCKHTEYDEIDDELKAVVDMGGKVLDVIVEHPVYGEIKSPLMISSRMEVQDFMEKLMSQKAEPLSSLTEGVHIHTIEVPNEEAYDRIKKSLIKKGYLIDSK